MRKLAWLAIFLFAVAFSLTLAAAGNATFKKQLIDLLAYIGGSTYSVVSAKWMDLANYVSANGTYFLTYTLGILILGGVFWIGVRKLWAWGAVHRPHLRTPSLKVSSPLAITEATHAVTPIGATTRPTPPTKTLTEVPELPEVKLTPEESAEK